MACSPEECAALQAQADILSAELVVLNAELAVLNAEIQAANDALELTYWQMWECECESSGSRATGDLSPAEIAATARRKVESLVAASPRRITRPGRSPTSGTPSRWPNKWCGGTVRAF